MNEFDLINQYFKKLAGEGSLGLSDDAAVLSLPQGYELVVTSDTLNAGTHFFEGQDAGDIAHKSLAVNISDLMAMGARPYCYQLNVAFPDKPLESWLKTLSESLLGIQNRYGMFCSGGDTTRIGGPLSISITAMGLVEAGKAVKRSGAQVGDIILLSDYVGDAYLGYKALHNSIVGGESSEQDTRHSQGFFGCVEAYLRPDIPPGLHEVVEKYARAACDVSDGVLADLGHICHASACDASIKLDDFQFSQDAMQAMEAGLAKPIDLLTGGDDYKTLMAVDPAQAEGAMAALRGLGQRPQIVGEFKAGDGRVCLYDKDGQIIPVKQTGWSHF